MTNALRQIEKGFLLLIMTPPQPQSSERVDDNMSAVRGEWLCPVEMVMVMVRVFG